MKYLTVEVSKHIGMLSGTDKGFEVREYFIECERRARGVEPTPSAPTQALPPLRRLQGGPLLSSDSRLG
jgi:phage anti-repressor protein